MIFTYFPKITLLTLFALFSSLQHKLSFVKYATIFFLGLRSALILFMSNKVNSLSTNCHKDLTPNLDPRALLGA